MEAAAGRKRPGTPRAPLLPAAPLRGPLSCTPGGCRPRRTEAPLWVEAGAGGGALVRGAWPHVCLQLLRDTSGGGQGDRQPAGRLAPCQLPSPRGQGDRQPPQIGGVVVPPPPHAVGKDWGSVPCPPTAACVLQLARAACPACLGAAFAPGKLAWTPREGGSAWGGSGWWAGSCLAGVSPGSSRSPHRAIPRCGLMVGSPRRRHGCGSTATCRSPAGRCPPCARLRPSPWPSPRCRSFTASPSPASWMRRPRREFLHVLLL